MRGPAISVIPIALHKSIVYCINSFIRRLGEQIIFLT